VEIGWQTNTFDATNKQTIPNVIPLNALNRFEINKKRWYSEEVNLMPKTTLNEKNTVLYVSVDEHGKIAKMSHLKNHLAFILRK
jgi:hypothetical protein